MEECERVERCSWGRLWMHYGAEIIHLHTFPLLAFPNSNLRAIMLGWGRRLRVVG